MTARITKDKKMKCRYCGTVFIRTTRPTQKYCSAGCRQNHANVRVTARLAKSRANVQICVNNTAVAAECTHVEFANDRVEPLPA